MRIFKVMNFIMKKQLGFVMLSLMLGTLTVMASVGLLSTSALLISRAALHPEVLDLMVLIVVVRFFGISRGVFRYFERIISHDTTFRMLSYIRKWVYKSFNDSYSENNTKFKTGDVYTKIVNEVDVLKDFYLKGFYPFIIAVLTGILTAMFISYFNKTLGLIYIIGYTFSGFIFPIILFLFNNKLAEKESNIKKHINIILLDAIKGILEIQVYNLKGEIKEKFSRLNKELSKLQKKKTYINAIGDNINTIIISILMAITLMITAEMVEESTMLQVYYAVLPLTIMASFEALIPLTLVIYKFNETYNSGQKIFSIVGSDDFAVNNSDNKAEKVDLSGGFAPIDVIAPVSPIESYDLSVNNLFICDKSKENYIVKELSFELPYKKKIALVGISGSGKSTLLKSLLGFVKYDKGTIKLGGFSYEELKQEDIRKVFTYVEQNPYVFNTTIRENLLIADTEADELKINNLLQKVQILNLIEELPNGLDSVIGQYGYKISGGEKQRLVIARALLKNSEIILLDEPTSSLDIETEKKVLNGIHEMIKDKSCLWVTHRLVGMDKMDEIIVLEEGSVIERGTHRELIDGKGKYYDLWSLQKNMLGG
jgi:ATP-binding cassette subfamily C protein CydC